MRTVAKGHVAVLQWWVMYNDLRAFTALELDLVVGHENLEIMKLMLSHTADFEKPKCTTRAVVNTGWNRQLLSFLS